MLNKIKTLSALFCLAALLTWQGASLATDIVVTGSNVKASASSNGTRVTYNGVAGVAITAGQCLYTGTNNQLYLLSATMAFPLVGIALNNAAAGQPVSYVTYDPAFIDGGTHNPGDVICISSTLAGNITLAPNVSGTAFHGNYVTVVSVATGTFTVNLQPLASGTPTP